MNTVKNRLNQLKIYIYRKVLNFSQEEERKHVHRTASALVRESHDQRKQIHMVRQREKAAMDEKLKKKLQMAAPKKQVCDNQFKQCDKILSSMVSKMCQSQFTEDFTLGS